MGRPPRWLPQDDALVEVTYRTIQGRLLELEQLPCWAHLSWREYLRRIRDLIRKIEQRFLSTGSRSKCVQIHR